MKYCTACKAKYDDSVSFCSIDGEVLEADPASIVNTVLDGQYQMEALLGKGGMGAVYRARHILLGDRVAIKVLPPEVRNNAEWLRRFRREGQAARRFRHPNAVTVYDLRTAADGTIYMVMEYVEGHTLDHELKTRGQFSAREAFETLSPIMSVLDTAHSMGVVHRDLKPENIMVGRPAEGGEEVVKLLDLGIAKMREIAGDDNGGNTALTMAGQVLGTPYYMSPEQWGEIPRDGSTEIDGRADIYSLGLVFYEMILGRRCFAGNTLHELRREHVTTTPRPLHEVVADVPRGFSDAIVRATAKDRGDRQATTRILADELRAGLDTPSRSTGPISEQPTPLAETVAIPRGVQTNSDVNAPTILTVEPAPTSPVGRQPAAANDATVYEPAKPAPPPVKPAPPAATVAESAANSIVTVPQVPTRPVPEVPKVAPAAPASKSKAGLLIGVAVVLILIVGGGVGAFLIWNKTRSSTAGAGTANTTATHIEATPREFSRYWLELEPAAAGGKPTRVAGLVPIASGQSFKFHFTFDEDGYLYIFGPGGDTNEPTAFLTTKPLAQTGVTSNKVAKGVEFSFPTGAGNNLTLDKNPGTDNFTVVFSKTLLPSPSFFNNQVTGEPLPAAQQADLKTFVARYQDKRPVTELDESNAQAPSVKVKAPADQTNNPIVFEIRIQHN
ncbi:MAG TPA: protein kinase [Pyrinomonadaceae bacterium]|jgi:serine/threonine-protein kinase|nr:protein kinase [Pyrinomonadaceae bacterium]